MQGSQALEGAAVDAEGYERLIQKAVDLLTAGNSFLCNYKEQARDK